MEPQLQSSQESEPIVRVPRNTYPETLRGLGGLQGEEARSLFSSVTTDFIKGALDYSDQGVRFQQVKKLLDDHDYISFHAGSYGYDVIDTIPAFNKYLTEISKGVIS